jgi:hypothetical protein
MAYLRNAGDMLLAVRDNLDERTPAFWNDDQLYRYLTRAADAVHTECRKMRADYHLHPLASTSGPITIFGESYDPAELIYQPGARGVNLPPDVLDLRTVECITAGLEWVTFDLSKDISHPDFRALRQLTERQTPTRFLGRVVGDRVLTLAPMTNTPLSLLISYVGSSYIFAAGIGIVRAFTQATDTIDMPFPLYQAIEQWATAFAHLQDRNAQMAGEFERRAITTCARVVSVDMRQSQDPEFVRDYEA